MSTKIIIVEDEQDLARSLSFSLSREGFEPLVAHTGGEGIELALNEPNPALLLLDLMLPDMTGTEVCRRLRSEKKTESLPIIMLTARDDEIDRVVGFEVGADDYVTKPFSTRELVLRIRAVLKRQKPAEPQAKGEDVFEFGCLRIDQPAHRIWVSDAEVTLTALEYRLLETLVQRRGRVQTRNGLLEDVWGYSPDVSTRTVDTHIKRLRTKLGDAAEYVETLRGVGYRFKAQP
ncbi:MAG: two-component system phosphate regulon response regulator PhoB [Bradymonadia bacterium]|jgi:two-component system phosphate regulon response regulator PhoB